MRNIFFSLSYLFGILLLSGCGDDSIAPLERDSGKIAKQAIIKELNKQIETSYGNQAFLLTPQKIMIVSSGVNQAVNSSGSNLFSPLEVISVARKYNASQIAYDVVGVSSSQVRKKKDSQYPYQAKLTISVNITYEEYRNFSGLPLRAVIPMDWVGWDSQKRESFVKELYSKLPPAEFDYKVIAETPGSNTETMRDNWNVEVVWNQNTKQWEISGATEAATTVNAPPPPWQGTAKNKNANLELVQKLERGLIYSNGKWVELRIVQAMKTFYIALERWNRNRDFPDLTQMMKELNLLSGTEAFPNYAQLATAGVLAAIKSMEQRKDEKSLEKLSLMMKSDPTFAAISSEELQNTLNEAKKNVQQWKDKINQQKQEKIKDILAEKINLQDILKTFAPTKITFSSFAGLNELQAYAKTNENVKNYQALLGLVYDRPGLIGNRDILSQQLFVDLLQDCRKCHGTGKIVCSVCKGSGVCYICHGSGYKTITTFASDGRRGFVEERVPCPTKCRWCPADPTCASCSGTGKIILKRRAQGRMIDYYNKIMADLNEDIEKLQKELEK